MSVPKAVPPLHGYLPIQPARTYDAVGYCIYCGSTDQLSDEHVIPLGLGGRLVLPRSSCSRCSSKTSKLERTCLRTMYGPLRLLYGLPSRRKNSRPEALQLKVKKTEQSEWEYVPVVQERYPFLTDVGTYFVVQRVGTSGQLVRDCWCYDNRLSSDTPRRLYQRIAAVGPWPSTESDYHICGGDH